MTITFEALEALVMETDAIAIHYFAQGVSVQQKADASPVTQADCEIESVIDRWRQTHYPGVGIWGEEWGQKGEGSPCRLIVDPIDGTRNFIGGNPVFATLIGVEVHGELVMGMVSAPAMARRWWGQVGLGAWGSGPEGSRPLRVSSTDEVSQAQVFHGSLYGVESPPDEGWMRVLKGTYRQRGVGDFFSHVLVASGAGDYSVDDGLKAWDMAALVPIVVGAGGRVSNWDGGFSLAVPTLLCSNGHLHDQVIQQLRG